MDPKTIEAIRAIASEATQNALFGAWWFWVVAFVLPAVSAWVGAYFKKRGETAALASDLKAIERQLASNTRATEEVKASIGFSDWWAKESLTIRRQQLENLVMCAYRADSEIHNWWTNATTELEGFFPIPSSSLHDLNSLVALYHPDLTPEYREFASAWHGHVEPGLIIVKRLRSPDARNAHVYEGIQADSNEIYGPLSSRMTQACNALAAAAHDKMAELLSPLPSKDE